MPINTVYNAEQSLISADISQKFTYSPKVEQVPSHGREPTDTAGIFSFKDFN